MARSVSYAWLQLSHDKLKLLAAVGGISFAIVLVFMQLGLRAALFDSAVRLHRSMDYELIMLSPRTPFLAQSRSFPRSRLMQVRGFAGVESLAPVYLSPSRYYFEGSPQTHRNVMTLGVDPSRERLRLAGVQDHLEALKRPETVLIDRYSRVEFRPVISAINAGDTPDLQLNDRRVHAIGLFSLGTSFGVDSSVVTSDLNFMRIFPDRDPGLIELGLIGLQPGADIHAVQAAIRAAIPADVLVLTASEYAEREIAYWRCSTPIGYVFSLGAVIGVLVGLIIVYQILFSDVQSHIAEYATLKAMGYTQGFLRGLIFKEAVILSVLGFLPALGLSMLLYDQAEQATQLPMLMTRERASMVFGVTVAMCAFSGMLAIRKLKGLDPAEVF